MSIPVSVVSGELKRHGPEFELIDRRDHAHVGYKRVNKKTGEAVENKDIVRGVKMDNGKYAVFRPEDLRRLRIPGSGSIDLQKFVERDQIAPAYFKKFYYLQPSGEDGRTYVLLRETLRATDSFAIGLIVLSGRQQLAAIGAEGRALVLHILHYGDEIRAVDELDLPSALEGASQLTLEEMRMAETLVAEMSGEWDPFEFKDTYREQLNEAVKGRSRRKSRAEVAALELEDAPAVDAGGRVLDLMPLLQRSLKEKTRKRPTRRHSPH